MQQTHDCRYSSSRWFSSARVSSSAPEIVMVKRKCGIEIQVMEYQYMVVDAFSPRPFRGNPAAVVLINGELSDEIRQSIAAEFNLAETAFVQPLADGQFGLRWFTPIREVPLCGH